MVNIIIAALIIYLIFRSIKITIINPIKRDIFLGSEEAKLAHEMMFYRSQQEFMNSRKGIVVDEK